MSVPSRGVALGRTLPLAGFAGASLGVYAVGFRLLSHEPATTTILALHGPLLALQAGAAVWLWRRPGASWRLVVAAGLLFRLVTLADPPSLSSDLNRYAWDGHVQRAGMSPYAHPPGDPALAALRDDAVWPAINRPAERTVYPPGAQLLFIALPFDVDAVRLAMIACDLITMLLLVALLDRRGRDPARVLLYAWSPLVVYEAGNNGHLESVVAMLLVASVLALHSARTRLGAAILGLATAIKLYPMLAIAALDRKDWARSVPLVILPGALLYAVYAADAGTNVLGFLPRYVGSAEDHNIGLRVLCEWLIAPVAGAHTRALAFALCLVVLAIGLWIVSRNEGPIERKLLHVALLHVLAIPTAMHPWYALWLVPWLCLHPSAAGLWLAATLPLSYLKYGAPDGVMPAWVVPIEFGPAAGLFARDLWTTRRRGATIAIARAA